MLEIIKIANDLKLSNDIIVTAGILSRLKNKIVNFFSGYKREQTKKMIEQTDELKPKLVETYDVIRNVEEAINDLDVKKYEQEMKNLEPKIKELSNVVKKMQALTNEPRYRSEISPDYIQNYMVNDKLYDTLYDFGKQFDVNLEYGTNIIGNRTGLKSIFTAWAANVFVGKLRPKETGRTSPGQFEKEHDDPMEFSNMQDQISENEMEKAIYENIPHYKIKSVKPREFRVVDGKNTGIKKRGEVEVFLTSDWITMPSPAENWKLKINFVIVDNGDPKKTNNFIIYRQWVVGSKKGI